jgi:hypothetical protein
MFSYFFKVKESSINCGLKCSIFNPQFSRIVAMNTGAMSLSLSIEN